MDFCKEQFVYDRKLEKNDEKKREKKKGKERIEAVKTFPGVQKKYETIRQRFQSELRRNLLKDVVSYLLERRSDCIDDLPPCAVSFDDPKYYSYKCRTNRRTSISAKMQMLMLQLPGISDETKDDMKAFCAYAKALDGAERRTQGEIQHANIMLDSIITNLKNEQVITRYRSLTIDRKQETKKMIG